MSWKDWSYTKKGFFIGIIINILIFIIGIFLFNVSSLEGIFMFHYILLMRILGYGLFNLPDYGSMVTFLISIGCWLILIFLTSTIGFIVGKIKSSRGEK